MSAQFLDAARVVCSHCGSRAWSRCGSIAHCYRCCLDFDYYKAQMVPYVKDLARECLRIQLDIARKVKVELGIHSICVFDGVGEFDDAETKVTTDGFRYLVKGTKSAVLSSAAQRTLNAQPEIYIRITECSGLVKHGSQVWLSHQLDNNEDLTTG